MQENDHIVLIRSDGSVVYEDGFEPETDEEVFEDDYPDEF